MRHSASHHRGFTLVELMVVIVMMAILASLVVMNLGGVDQRKAMQAREIFLLDIAQIRREADDQAQVFALELKNDVDGALSYQIVQYQQATADNPNAALNKWITYSSFPQRQLPRELRFEVTPTEQNYANAQNQDLVGENAPKLMWLGNGEVKPVRIQFYFQQRPLGDEINIDYLGKVHVS